MSAPVRVSALRRRPRWDSRRQPKEEPSPVGDAAVDPAAGPVAGEEVHEPASTLDTGNTREERTAEHLKHL